MTGDAAHDKAGEMRRVEIVLGNLLRAGVVISVGLMALGVLVSLVRHPEYLSDPATLDQLTKPGARFPFSLADVLEGLRSFKGRAIMTAGLILLILTPVLRVAVSVIAYAKERDWRFVAITGFVLVVLIISFLVGATG